MYKFFNFLRTSSLWIAFASAFGPILLCQLFALPLEWWQPVAVGLATWAVYSLDKVSGSLEDLLNTPERAWLANWPIKKLAMIAYFAAIILVAAFDIWRLPAILSFGFAGYIYTKKVRGYRLKDLPGAKNLIVALATAICYAGLLAAPLAAYILIFLLIYLDTVLFDMRDLAGDAASDVKTLPVLLGTSRTLEILAVIDIAIFALSPTVGILGAIFIYYFGKERPNWQYDLLVDGWMLWAFLISEILK